MSVWRSNFGGRKQWLDLFNIRSETLVQKAVCLIENQSVQLGGRDTSPRVREDVLETSRGADEQMASLLLDLGKTGTLLGSTNSGLDNKTSAKRNLFSLNCDLFRKFASRGNNKSTDFRRASSSWAAADLGHVDTRVIQNVLKGGYKESKRLAGSCFGLGEAEKRFRGLADQSMSRHICQ
jgi:hypothetical protein